MINLFLELFIFLKEKTHNDIFITICCLNNETYTNIIYKQKLDDNFHINYDEFVKLINDNLFNKFTKFEDILQISNDEKLINILIGNIKNRELITNLNNYITKI